MRSPYSKREEMLKSFDGICNGEGDDLPEQASLYVGDLDEGGGAGEGDGDVAA